MAPYFGICLFVGWLVVCLHGRDVQCSRACSKDLRMGKLSKYYEYDNEYGNTYDDEDKDLVKNRQGSIVGNGRSQC